MRSESRRSYTESIRLSPAVAERISVTVQPAFV
ncbi:Uncharacterised protein [Mycobacteroides abscessus subsp. abscessus]|nr:Uncharacterised protein [Mycobacteroides abscessus subsp. abscessus]